MSALKLAVFGLFGCVFPLLLFPFSFLARSEFPPVLVNLGFFGKLA